MKYDFKVDMNNILPFLLECQLCKRVINNGMLMYKHPKYGYICEYCPEFNEGQISKIESEDK